MVSFTLGHYDLCTLTGYYTEKALTRTIDYSAVQYSVYEILTFPAATKEHSGRRTKTRITHRQKHVLAHTSL